MTEINFTPFPELRTERLLLRKLKATDAPILFFLRSNSKVLEYLARPKAKSIEEVQEFIRDINKNLDEGIAILWGISLLNNPEELIGTICLWHISVENQRAETGYMLHPEHWRKGIMKEALLKVLEYGFDVMNLHSIEARLDPANSSSVGVLETTGFVREGYFKEDHFYDGKFMDTLVYSKLKG
jgi:ribosomal-protein-alanine N-acetyltransferase